MVPILSAESRPTWPAAAWTTALSMVKIIGVTEPAAIKALPTAIPMSTLRGT